MTARDAYEYILIELNKLEAPTLLLEDFIYFFNKAVQQYINLNYVKFEMDQQSIDDLRVLKTIAVLTPQKLTQPSIVKDSILESSYYVDLPLDYLHLITCIIKFKVPSKSKCDDGNKEVTYAASPLTSDLFTQVLNNAYLKPTYKHPYYSLININDHSEIVSNETMDNTIEGETLVDMTKDAYSRLVNPYTVRLELKFGDNENVIPQKVYVDYLKAPMKVQLTYDQIYATSDTSQTLEFPDYVCHEIINLATRLILENISDPRLQSNMALNNTIINPVLAAQAKDKND